MLQQGSMIEQEISPILMENPSNFDSIEGVETGTIGDSKLPKTMPSKEAEFSRTFAEVLRTSSSLESSSSWDAESQAEASSSSSLGYHSDTML